jgi:hypothetical protein
MGEIKDIRWVQRYENFRSAFLRLKEAIEMDKHGGLRDHIDRVGRIIYRRKSQYGNPR